MPYKNNAYRREHYQKNKKRILENNRKWRQLNKEKIATLHKNYYEKNKEKLKKYRKEWYQQNKEERAVKSKKYYEKNKEEIRKYIKEYNMTHKKQSRERYNNRYHNDIRFKLNQRISKAIWKSLKRGKGGLHWENPVGYTLRDLMERLKKTLPEGMTWQDYIDGKLHIDHIIPISAFNFDSYNNLDFRRCWALENLRFLKVRDNLKKGSKINKSFQPNLKI